VLPWSSSRWCAETAWLRALLVCALFCAAGPARAASDADESSWRVTVWTIADGLPQGTINAIGQTSDGALWIATFGGLLRFDGIEFRAYELDALAGVPMNRLTGLAVDERDGLWLLTQAGHVVLFKDGVVTEVRRSMAPESYETVGVMLDADGSPWVRATGGDVRHWERDAWQCPLVLAGETTFNGMCRCNDGSRFFALAQDLHRVDPTGRVGPSIRAPSRIWAVADAQGGGPWLGLQDGLARVREGNIERVAIENAPPGMINCILADGEGGLWLSGPTGVVHVVVNELEGRARVDSGAALLPDFEVRSMLRDREGNVWVGSRAFGLARLSRTRIERPAPREENDPVSAVVSDGAGGAWIGSERVGLKHLRADGGLEHVKLPIDGPHPQAVLALLCDRKNRLWVSTSQSVLRSEGERFVAVATVEDLSARFGPIVEDRDGHVWVSKLGGELFEYGPDDRLLRTIVAPAPIVSLVAAPDGSLLVGGRGELMRFAGGSFERFGSAQGVSREDVRDALFDSDGSIWIATYGGGLGRLRSGHVTSISRAQGMPDVSLSRILDDGRGSFWMLSNRGLIVADKDELLDVAEGRRPRFSPVLLGPESGTPEGKFGLPAGARDEQGRLWFGTVDGVVRADPRRFPFNPAAPRMRIERVLAEDRPVPFTDTVEIPAGVRRAVVEFTAFALTAPERVHFRYRLEGLDDKWIDLGTQRSAVFTALKPGDYVFHAAARNEDGVWAQEPVSLRMTVLPSWWETDLFRAAAVLAIALAAFGLHRLRVHRLSQQSQILLLAAEERRLGEEKASRLREELEHVARVATAGEMATSLAHEVNQPLAAIVANAQAGRRFLAGGNVSRAEIDEILTDIAQEGLRASEVIKRLRAFLRKRPGESRTLDVNDELRAALPLVRRELQDHGAQVSLDLAENLPTVRADPVQLQQVVINLLKNACEAMSATTGPRIVALRTSARDGTVEIEVKDTGPGLAPELAGRLFQPFTTTKEKGMGLGLTICKSIVESHGGALAAEVHIERGMTFRVTLPVASNGAAT
jgi:signal transduction histidine kinase/ligand-binding sensor domain-containing protein